MSGRIDLTQAEAVLGVIDAADPRQLQTALGQLAGGLAGPLHQTRAELLELLAHLEAGFDFAEEDISFITTDELARRLASAAERVAALLEKMKSRKLAELAVKAVLIGRPNAGKSSLFNALLRRSGQLVSPTPGTTRRILAELDLDGVKCQLIDTAGIDLRRTVDDHPSPLGRGPGGEGWGGKTSNPSLSLLPRTAPTGDDPHSLPRCVPRMGRTGPGADRNVRSPFLPRRAHENRPVGEPHARGKRGHGTAGFQRLLAVPTGGNLTCDFVATAP